MDVPMSQQVKASQHPVCSPDGAYIAALNGSRLQIRTTASLELVRAVNIRPEPSAKFTPIIRWAPAPKGETSRRVLYADEDKVRVWDLRDPEWLAVINNGSAGMGKLTHAEFGRTANEALVFTDFGAKVTVWELASGRSVEIRDPKFYKDARAVAYRPKDGIMALLSRPGAQDVLTLHSPGSYRVLKTVLLPSADAQGLMWRPDGKWLAVWDTPSVGTKLYIYTADGNLFRTWDGWHDQGQRELGVKSLAWSPRLDCLAVGSYNERVALLNMRTFSTIGVLAHHSEYTLDAGENAWQESVSATSGRSYSIAAQPVNPPRAPRSPSEPIKKLGISTIAFNVDGSFLATRHEEMPTTVWIWCMPGRRDIGTCTLLVQHAPVKQVSWHPTNPALLLIHCAHEDRVVYLWDAARNEPRILSVPLDKAGAGGKMESRWLATPADRKPAIVCSDAHGFLTMWPDGKDDATMLDGDGADGRPVTPGGSVNDSDDSLYNILTGRTPLPELADPTATTTTGSGFEEGSSGASEALDDTFGHKQHLEDPLRDSECF